MARECLHSMMLSETGCRSKLCYENISCSQVLQAVVKITNRQKVLFLATLARTLLISCCMKDHVQNISEGDETLVEAKWQQQQYL